MKERARTQEQKGQNLDFVQIFHQKLESIEPLSEEESRKWMELAEVMGITEDFKELGIVPITKLAEGIIFVNPNRGVNPDLEIWIEDQRDTDGYGYPHNVVADWLKIIYPDCIPIFAASLIQNDQGTLCLLLDPTGLKLKPGDDILLTPLLEKWLSLSERYNLEKIIGNFERKPQDGDSQESFWKTKVIVNQDLLGAIREERHIRAFGQNHNMTPRQLVEFTRKVLEAQNPTVPIPWAQIAESVMFR